MRDLVNYSCTKCGGSLIAERDQEVSSCPFCGNAFDLIDLHRKELIDDARACMMNMEFETAKVKLESVLSSDPSNHEALRDIVICDAGLRSIDSVKSIERMQNCNLDAMKKSCEEVKSRAIAEDIPYFDKLSRLTDLAGQYNGLCNEEFDLSAEFSKTQKEILLHERKVGYIGLALFTSLYAGYSVFLCLFGNSVKDWRILPLAGISAVLLALVFLKPVDILIVKPIAEGKTHAVLPEFHMKEDAIVAQKNKVEEEYKDLYEELIAMEPASGESSLPVFMPVTETVKRHDTEDQDGLFCSKCKMELVPDEGKKIYRCMNCGIAYGYSVLFDEESLYKAWKSMEESEFNEADLRFTCILMRDPKDRDALRGRILCAGKWKYFEEMEASDNFSQARLKIIRERLKDAIEHCGDQDKEYFLKIESLTDTFEEVCKREVTLKEREKSYDEVLPRSSVFVGLDDSAPNVPYNTRKKLEADVEYAKSKRDSYKERLDLTRREIIEMEKAKTGGS